MCVGNWYCIKGVIVIFLFFYVIVGKKVCDVVFCGIVSCGSEFDGVLRWLFIVY